VDGINNADMAAEMMCDKKLCERRERSWGIIFLLDIEQSTPHLHLLK
jgi:hypothetical protein